MEREWCEQREGLGEATTTGDGEIFNSLLIKANFLWLSLPGNPLGGFSGGNGGVDGVPTTSVSLSHASVCMYMRMYAYVCVCMRVYVYVYMCVCMCVPPL